MASSSSNVPATSATTEPSINSSNLGTSMPYLSKKFIGAVEDEWQLYSDVASDYTIGSPIGFGASSIVYAAVYQPRASSKSTPPPSPIPCALKVLDLDSLPPRSLSLLQRETTLMSLSKHPNVLRVRGTWMDGHKLYIAMRLMNKGSAADVMRYGWPGGMEEDVVRCILRQTLQGLNYLHINGFIHRDVKAANLLIDDDGTVLLGDLGVAADLAEESSHQLPSSSARAMKAHNVTSAAALTALSQSCNEPAIHTIGSNFSKRAVAFDAAVILPRPQMGKRKSFVGTPCWMAPELIQGRQYDSSADIWSFGITALELTQGRPPRSRESPQRVLLRTIQEAPPTLDRDGGTYKYSRAFKDVVESCLIKDPSKRPSAEQLLQTPFFRSAKKPSYLYGAILKDLPPLTQRQERRVTHHTQTHRYIDSWDFATTLHSLHSATTGVYHRRVLEDLDGVGAVEEVEEGDRPEGVFDMESEVLRNATEGSRSPDHSRNHSWTDNFDAGQDNASELPPSSSPPDSTALDSSRSSPESDSTPPSSVAESPPFHNQPKAHSATTTSLPLSAMPQTHNPVSVSVSPEGSVATHKLALRSSTSQPGLWSKIKSATNSRRPPSHNGLSAKDNDARKGKDEADNGGSSLLSKSATYLKLPSSRSSPTIPSNRPTILG